MLSASVASRSSALAHLVEVGDLRCACRAGPSPEVGCSSPRISFSSVVLPAPFGPIRPTLSPRRRHRRKSRTIVRASLAGRPGDAGKTMDTSFELGDDLAARDAGVGLEPDAAERLAPCGPLRAQRLQPLDASDAARAARLDALAHPNLLLREQLVGARARQRLGGELGLPCALRRRRKHRGSCAARPRSSSTMRVATASRNARSWVTTMTLPAKPTSSSSSQAIESRSRWLVGSSRSSRSGTATSTHARATRFFIPPESSAIVRAPCEMQSRQRRLDALLRVPRVERLDPRLQLVEVDPFGMRLVGVAQRARLGDTFADRIEHDAGAVELRLLRDVADAQALRLLAADRRRASRARR